MGHRSQPWRRWPQWRCFTESASLSQHLAIRLESHGLEEPTRTHKTLCLSQSAGMGRYPIWAWKSNLLPSNSFIWHIYAVLIIGSRSRGLWNYKTWYLSSGYLLISHASDNRRTQNCCLLPENNIENCIWGVWGLCRGELVRSDHRSRRSYNLYSLITDQKLSLISRCSKALAYIFKKKLNTTLPFLIFLLHQPWASSLWTQSSVYKKIQRSWLSVGDLHFLSGKC